MKPSREIGRLIEIMAALRTSGSGCPWDLEQTFATIVPFTLEEAYEVADAVERGDFADLRDELGDLLLQVVFHARMAEEEGRFDFGGVVEAITAKLIRRHPHVFADARDLSPDEVKLLWGQIKAAEKRASRPGSSAERASGSEPSAMRPVPGSCTAFSSSIPDCTSAMARRTAAAKLCTFCGARSTAPTWVNSGMPSSVCNSRTAR